MPASTPVTSLYQLKVTTLDGKPSDLGQYQGKVALVVNTASECGYTPQYAGLEKLAQEYRAKGLVVLGFPSNDFNHQEPGTAQEIATFCQKNYGVTFPLFEKIITQGEGQSPVYQFLTAGHGKPRWNFHKYLVNQQGQVIGEFPSGVTPESKELHNAIDAALL